MSFVPGKQPHYLHTSSPGNISGEDTDVLLGKYGVLKVTEEQYWKIDREYIIAVRKEEYGYRCLTNEKQFYLENYPDMVVEKSGIDELILMEKKEK